MDKFKTQFCDYKVIRTDDNSQTLYSRAYDENCHSLAGARSETLHNYIHGCQLNRFCRPSVLHNDFSVLEVGFGLGVGLLTTLDYLKEQNFKNKISFISLEIDSELIDYTIKENSSRYPFLHNLNLRNIDGQEYYFYEDEKLLIKILIGDAKQTLPLFRINNPDYFFSAIYQDAFSPKKNPELWTIDWFTTLYNFSNRATILSTYSAASLVKNNLKSAGFEVQTIKGYHLKKTISIARFKDQND